MKRTVTICILLSLALTAGCGRRVTVKNPAGARVVVDDRVVDILADRSLAEVIARAPQAEQAGLIREWINAKERLANQVMQNEDKRSVSFWQSILEILKYLGPAAAGYYAAR
jgi:hypothetical protein